MERCNLFEELKERMYVYQMTNEEEVRKLCNGEPTAVYVGIDPTADSLHIGHCVSLMMLRKFQDAVKKGANPSDLSKSYGAQMQQLIGKAIQSAQEKVNNVKIDSKTANSNQELIRDLIKAIKGIK